MNASKTYFALLLAPLAVGAVMLPGCGTSPPTQEGKENLSDETHTAFNEMVRADPSLASFVSTNYAYAVFPNIGKGAVGVGGSYGRGEVFKQNKFIGYADVTQGSIGASLGGQSYAELIVFQTPEALTTLTENKFKLSADASAVALKSGAAATAKFQNGVAVITQPKGGLMFDASVGGQQFSFTPTETENQ